MNSRLIAFEGPAGFVGLGTTVIHEVDGLPTSKVLYGEATTAVYRFVIAKAGGDEKEILETYKNLPKGLK